MSPVERGKPRLHIPAPELWSSTGRLIIGLAGADGRFVDSKNLSTAMARWTHIAATLATDDWLSSNTPSWAAVDWSSGAPAPVRQRHGITGRVVLVDEPEVHLHPVAERQIAELLLSLADEGTTVLAATHAAAMINSSGRGVSLVGVSRTGSVSFLSRLDDDLLRELDETANAFGADRMTWLQAVKGVLFVEGEHDIAVLRRFFGGLIASSRIAVMPLRGHKNLEGEVVLEFFRRLGVPIRVLLDDVDARAISRDPAFKPTTSEAKLAQKIELWSRGHPNVQVLAYPEPDVWCALPMAAVARAFPNARDVSWGLVSADWKALTNQMGFKKYALQRLGLEAVDPDDFITEVLRATSDADAPSEAITAAVTSAVDGICGEP